jgi:hypothetical protein
MSYDKVNQIRAWKCSFIFTGEEPCTKSDSGGGAKNRVIEVNCEKPVVEEGNAIVSYVNEHYGYAGKAYVDALIETGKSDLQMIFSGYFNEIISSCDTTEKQAQTMALILTADRIASDNLYSGEKPLTVEQIKQFLTSQKEVDVSERAFEYTVNLIAMHHNNFTGLAAGEIWGSIDKEKNTATINKDVLSRELNNAGYDFDAVKKKWSDNKHIELNSKGRYLHQTTCNGARATYIKLNLPAETIEGTETLPFVDK